MDIYENTVEQRVKKIVTELETVIFKSLIPELEELKRLAHTDSLTEILNRRGVKEEFEILFKEARYLKEHPEATKRSIHIADFSVLFLDVDNFKSINDTFGHDVGDHVLKLVAKVLKKNTRDIDMIGRYGGEEFVVAFVGMSEEEAFKKAEKIRKDLSSTILSGQHPDLKLTASLGVASLCNSSSMSLEELVGFADKAMYEAKTKRGKNNTVRWSELA